MTELFEGEAVLQNATRSAAPHETLTINEKGVFLNGNEICRCKRVDIANIGTLGSMEVILHMDMDEIDVQWTVR